MAKEKREKSNPVALSIDVTENCNLACAYCYKGEKESRTINPQVLRRSIEKIWPIIKQHGSLSLGFMGGEPLIEFPTIRNVVTCFKKRCAQEDVGFSWGFTTNATLLNEEMFDFILENKGKLHCSIDGDSFSQNHNRPWKSGGGSFEAIFNRLSLIKSAGGKTVRGTITPATASMLFRNITFLIELGFEGISFFPAFEKQAWESCHFIEIVQQSRLIAENRFFSLKQVKVLKPFDQFAYFVTNGIREAKITEKCGVCNSSIALDINGQFYPCHRFTNNTNSSQFQIECFDSAAEENSWERIKSVFRETTNGKCCNCELFPACRGGCYAQNFSLTGHLEIPSKDLCEFNKSLARGIVSSGFAYPKDSPPRRVAVSGEFSCLLLDVCGPCDCSHCSCDTSCDRCEDYCWCKDRQFD